MAANPWDILGIPPTRDAGDIRRAYARALKGRRPDEDAAGFQLLVEARARALAWHWPEPDEATDAEDAWLDEEPHTGVVLQRFTEAGFMARLVVEPSAFDPVPHPGFSAAEEVVEPLRFDPVPRPTFGAASPDLLGALTRGVTALLYAGDDVNWELAAWQSALHGHADLDLRGSQRLRETLMREVPRRLPPLPDGAGARRAPPLPVVDLLETEFGLTQDQPKLAAAAGTSRALLYLGWVDLARRELPPARPTPAQSRVLALLDALDADHGLTPFDARPWDVARWQALLAALGNLGADDRAACLLALARHLGRRLPPAFDETLRVYTSGHSVAAVVEAVEQSLEFSRTGRRLLPGGEDFAEQYDAWLQAAAQLRSIRERLASGSGYADAHGIPVLPPGDRGIEIWTDPRFARYWAAAQAGGRWPPRLDWRALLTPLTELTTLGVPSWLTRLIVLAGSFAAVIASDAAATDPDANQVAAFCVGVFVLARLPFAVANRRLAILLAMARVRRADRAGLSAPASRAARIRTGAMGRSQLRRVFEVVMLLTALAGLVHAVVPSERLDADVSRGVALSNESRFPEAIAAFSQALQAAPDHVGARVGRGVAHFRSDDEPAALEDLTRALALDPSNREALRYRSWMLAQRGRFADAMADYDASLSVVPTDAGMLNGRGLLRERMGDHARAVADFTAALAAAPRFAEALQNRAESFANAGDFGRAVADDTAALALGGGANRAKLLARRGWSFLGADDATLAIGDFRRAIRLAPGVPGLERALGYALFDDGAFAASAAVMPQGLEPLTDPYGALFLHLARARAGVPDPAGLATAAALWPSSAWPRPVFEFFLGQRTRAALEAAAANIDQRCEAAFYIGEAEVLQGRLAAGRDAFRTAEAICPHRFVEWKAARMELRR